MDEKSAFIEQIKNSTPEQTADTSTGSGSSKTTFSVARPALPAGGGAITGIGEIFNTDEFTGTATITIPFATATCREMQPDLSLSYSSGSGNGIFGMGWSVDIPNISTQTALHVPKYDGTDTFVLTGSDYLVPYNYSNAPHLPLDSTLRAQGYDSLTYYQPRTQVQFSIIQRWQKSVDLSETIWVVTDKENNTLIFGLNESARIFNPADSRQIFCWYLQEIYDSKGNHILFEYQKENGAGINKTGNELNRNTSAQTYISKVSYGNDQPISGSILLSDTDVAPATIDWHFYVVFDYGSYDIQPTNRNPFQQTGEWALRPDPFSDYITGFEVRTYRLCRNVLMFNSFAQINADEPTLISAFRFNYEESAIVSLLSSVDKVGYTYNSKNSPVYTTRAFPPLELFYSPFPPAGASYETLQCQKFVQEDGKTVTALTQDAQFNFADMEAQGIPGILYTDGTTVLYREPIAALSSGVQYSNWKDLNFPLPRLVNTADYSLMDINADGRLDLVNTKTSQAGFNEYIGNNQWTPFQAFSGFPTDYSSPFQQYTDVTGNGVNDVLIATEKDIRYYPSLFDDGFAPAKLIPRPDYFPTSKINAEQIMYTWGSMVGGGLAQYIAITQKSITCWPSVGYGSFLEPVYLDNVPDFGENFDTARVRLADLDGSGFADLIYINDDSLDIYQNQSGNGLSDKITITLPAPWDSLDQFQFADINGMGCQCLIFTKTHPEPQQWYYDFNRVKDESVEAVYSTQKPYMLTGVVNNLGAETTIEYAGSAIYYLIDKANGLDWITKLPSVVQVVKKVTVADRISDTELTTTFAYHHGYYDWRDRAFKGFGRVDSTNYETFSDFVPPDPEVEDTTYEQPPVITKTWYFNGADQQQTDELLAYYKQNEYWQEDPQAPDLEPYLIQYINRAPDERETIDAFRTLAGSVIRKEIFGNDGTPWKDNPYTVEDLQYRVVQLELATTSEYCVFTLQSVQSFSFNYERNIDDPMVSQEFSLIIDNWGNVLEKLNISYSRRSGKIPVDMDKQTALQQSCTYITLTKSNYINTPDSMPQEDFYLLGVPYEERSYQLKNLILPAGQLYYQWNDVTTIDTNGQETLNWKKYYFCDTAGTNALPAGEITAQALPYRNLTAAFEITRLSSEYSSIMTNEELDALLTNENEPGYGGYMKLSGTQGEEQYYWNGANYLEYKTTFYLPVQNTDPFGNKYNYQWDEYNMVINKVIDPFGNYTEVTRIDYQSVTPQQIKDINGNYSEVTLDELGMVVATSYYGTEGGMPVGFAPLSAYTVPVDVTFNQLTANNSDLTPYIQQAASFFYYDLFAWMGTVQEETLTESKNNKSDIFNQLVLQGYITFEGAVKEKFRRIKNRQLFNMPACDKKNEDAVFQLLTETTNQMPVNSVALTATNYPDDNSETATKVLVAFNDGLGRTLETKLKITNPNESLAAKDSSVIVTDENSAVKWLTSGAVRYNNQGNAIQQFEPYYTETADYSNYEYGVSSLLYYDSLNRLILTESPRNIDDDGHQVGVSLKQLTGSLISGEQPFPASDFSGFVSTKLYSTLQQKFVPGPWCELAFDANETVVDSSYYKAAKLGDIKDLPAHELASLDKAAAFYNYCHFEFYDTMGREVQSGYINAASVNISNVAGSNQYILLDIYGNHLTTTDERINAASTSTFEQAPLNLATADAAKLFESLQFPPQNTLTSPVLNQAAGITSYYNPADSSFVQALANLLTTINVAVGQQDDVITVLNNQLALYNIKMTFNMLHQPDTKNSADSGVAWMLLNAEVKPLYNYDGRLVETRPYYDQLNRLTDLYVAYKGNDVQSSLYGLNQYVQKIVYGESLKSIAGDSFDPCYWNLLGQAVFNLNQSGLNINWFFNIINLPYATSLSIKKDYKNEASWDSITNNDWKELVNDVESCPGKDLYPLVITASGLCALLNSPNYANTYVYTATGLQVSISDPDKNITYQTFDEADRLQSLAIIPNLEAAGCTEAPGISSITYNAMGQRNKMLYKNGVQITSGYDPYTYWLKNITSLSKNGSETLQNLTYFYDQEGNVTYVQNNATEPVFTNNQQITGDNDYLYDSLYRLIQATGREQQALTNTNKQYGTAPAMASKQFSINDVNGLENYIQYFSYDTGNNLTQIKHTAINSANNWTRANNIESSSNRLASSLFSNDLPCTIQYDANGNMLNLSNIQNIVWDYRNQLQQTIIVERDGTSLNDAGYYTYGNNGMRTQKMMEAYGNGLNNGTYNNTIYIGGFETHTIGTLSGTGGQTGVTEAWKTIKYSDGNGNSIVWQYWTIKDGEPISNDQLQRYQLTDKLGSTTMEVDSNGDMLSYEEYYAYGGTSLLAGSSQVTVNSEIYKQYRYNGKERDANTGLYYFGLRYYCSWLGRWINPDPAGLIDGPNVYAYVSGNPATVKDQLGTNGNAKKQRVRDDSNALVADVRYMTSSEFEDALKLANRVHGEACTNPALFTDESVRFSAPLEKDLTEMFQKFAGSFAMINATLTESIDDAGGHATDQTTDQREQYKALRTKSNTTLPQRFPGVDFSGPAGARPLELHHIQYKALFPKAATTTPNFALTTRGSSSSGRIGTHEGLFHLITSGNDSSIYRTSIAGVQGLFKRFMSKQTGGTPTFVSGGPYSTPGTTPTTDFRSPSARIQLIEARKLEAAGGTTEYLRLSPSGGTPTAVNTNYRKRLRE